ncbi:transcription/translation regulatory transformer protein RfaH [Pseudomonas sp. xss_2]|uniref:transcription/translation regulatory transformer protein RfaH n=1 Tax=Pseudomonas sp. xss_2 TaxID=3367215 RepID=UPI00370A0C75
MNRQGWFLVQCKPRQDQRAEENLKRQGYECALLRCRRERLERGKLQVKLEPLFPGYLFIQMTDESNWAPLRSTRGVSHVVSFGGQPLPVSAELVAHLRHRAEIEITTRYKVGDNVRITNGSFAAFDAVFVEMDGEDRAHLLIRLLSRQQQISVALADITAH